MQRYPVRTSHRARLNPAGLGALLKECFGPVKVEGEKSRTSFGALESLTAWSEGRELAVDVKMNPKVPLEVAAETVHRYNRFLLDATGYSTKERARRLRRSPGA